MPSFLRFHRNLCVLPQQCGDTVFNHLFVWMSIHGEMTETLPFPFFLLPLLSFPSSLLPSVVLGQKVCSGFSVRTLWKNPKEPFVRAQLLSRVQPFCDPVDCSPPGSSVPATFQARILEQVAIFYSRGSS